MKIKLKIYEYSKKWLIRFEKETEMNTECEIIKLVDKYNIKLEDSLEEVT